MGRLDTINRHGLASSIRHGDILWFDPRELVSDDVRQLARTHRSELIAEIRASAGNTDVPSPEAVPAYHFLWVATTLESFEETDPRYGYETGRDPVFRMLDAPYYAWLRHHMENASKAHGDGRLSDDEYTILRDRFNVIHNWAIAHIGEDALRRAMRTTNLKRYVAPCDATVEAYHRTWDEARQANEARRHPVVMVSPMDAQPAKLAHLLATQGYAVIRSPALDDLVIIMRDDAVAVPTKWADKVRFTIDELTILVGAPFEIIRQAYDVKDIIGGRVMGDDETKPIDVDTKATSRSVPGPQHSLFGSPGGA